LEFSNYVTWDTVAETPTFIKAKNTYDIANGITFIKSFPEYTELYYFGTLSNNLQATELYRSNINLFDHFILYFKDRGKKLIDLSDTHPMYFRDRVNPIEENYLKSKQKPLIPNFDQYRFSHQQGNESIIFSKNESEFLLYYSLQYSMREIADLLSVCENTTYYYLLKIQNTLQCDSRKKLLKKMEELKLINPSHPENSLTEKSSTPIITCDTNTLFLQDTSIKKIYLDDGVESHFLTKAEATSLYYYCCGYSAKSIGKISDSSNKTIEQHLYTSKKKLGIRKKSALTSYCYSHGIFEKIVLAFPELLRD
jgi:DNA-binding NarL/FixJ family response regulator